MEIEKQRRGLFSEVGLEPTEYECRLLAARVEREKRRSLAATRDKSRRYVPFKVRGRYHVRAPKTIYKVVGGDTHHYHHFGEPKG